MDTENPIDRKLARVWKRLCIRPPITLDQLTSYDFERGQDLAEALKAEGLELRPIDPELAELEGEA